MIDASHAQQTTIAGPARCRAAIALAVLLALGAARAQSDDELVLSNVEGDHYSFRDENDPTRQVWVWIGGVEVRKGTRVMRGRSLIVVTDRSDDRPASVPDDSTGGGLLLSGDRVLEVFLDGDVSLEDGDEIVLGAQSLRLDNTTDEVTILEGEWRGSAGQTPLIVRYDVMRQLADESRELEGVSYTTCDFDHAHWSITTPWARIVPTLEGRVLHTAGNTVDIGGLPVLWLPGVHLNVDRDRPPIKRIGFGHSTQLGTVIYTTWGGDASAGLAATLGVPERGVKADWEFILDNYSSRGVFFQPKLEYQVGSSKGTIFGAYIDDRNKFDDLDVPIEDNSRGRVSLEHRTKLDKHRTVDVELSYLSDRGFLYEYYEDEDRNGKPQESYINFRDVEENEALQVLARFRLNDFDTQIEYMPEIERRTTGEALDTGIFGPAFFTGRSFISNAHLAAEDLPDPPPPSAPAIQPRSDRVLRGGNVGALNWPINVGEDRVRLLAGYNLTAFDATRRVSDDPSTPTIDEQVNDDGTAVRYAVTGGVEWARTYSGVGPAQSDLWNFDGVRQILEPRVGYASVLELNKEPDDLVLIDDTETLRKLQTFFVGVRHRIQTHQKGEVATVFDTDVSMPFFPNEDRDNPDEDLVDGGDGGGQTAGPITIDTAWKPGADIWGLRAATLRWQARIDPNQWAYDRSFLSYSSAIGPNRRLGISHDRVRHISNTLRLGVEWILTPKWSGAVFVEHDLRENEASRRGILLRQMAHRWLFDLELSQQRGTSRLDGFDDQDEIRVSLTIRPAFLADDEDDSLLDLLGRIRRT